MWKFPTTLSEVIQRTPEVKSFRFPIRAQNVDYIAGQFFHISIKIDGKDAEKHFSFSSSPTEPGYIEFTKRITAHEFSQALAKMKPGDGANLWGPAGTFTLPNQKRKLAFLSGGIGITPLRSILRYITDKGEIWDIVMLDGNNSLEEIVFKAEFDAISARNKFVRIMYTISGPDVPAGWQGKIGKINREMVSEVISDYKERLFYLSGPPGLVTSLNEQLLTSGVPKEQIKMDSFTGYD
jgi:ferredoxin-NADP reductase